MRGAPLFALGLCSCAVFATTEVGVSALSLLAPDTRVGGGEGEIAKPAAERISRAEEDARAIAKRDAIDAAAAAPNDLRLQRRAVAMVGEAPKSEQNAEPIHALLEHLVALAPCPGLADTAAAWIALGHDDRGADAYVQASRQCASAEAAVAAVAPLKRLDKCDEAVAVLHDAWPHVRGAKSEVGIAILDGVASCSDALTLERNLAFVPPDVLDGYFALVRARHAEQVEAERRAERERERQDAENRAFEARSNCTSECGAAVSSCQSGCQGDGSCIQSCSTIDHVCRSGC